LSADEFVAAAMDEALERGELGRPDSPPANAAAHDGLGA
jgi:hypothetical protein